MLKAHDAKLSVALRYRKVLFCGAAAAGKSSFLNLLMEEDFQSLHISTEVLKPQQVTTVVSTDDDKVEFKKMNIDDEILQLKSYLPENYTASTTALLSTSTVKNSLQVPAQNADPQNKNVDRKGKNVDNATEKNVFALANVNRSAKKLVKKSPGEIWDILTFMDTGGLPQLISMLPAVNSFAMITFIIHKIVPGGQKSLNEIVKVQYGNEKGEISFKPHPHKYTYHQLIETQISYASNILLPDRKFPDRKFLDKLKVKCKKN